MEATNTAFTVHHITAADFDLIRRIPESVWRVGMRAREADGTEFATCVAIGPDGKQYWDNHRVGGAFWIPDFSHEPTMRALLDAVLPPAPPFTSPDALQTPGESQ